jgi:hypothetical protein
VPEAIYALGHRPESITRSAAFSQGIHAGYDRLIGMIEAGDTAIAEPFRGRAAAVFRSWQAMNARFASAAGSTPGLDYQVFVTGDLARKAERRAAN